MELVHAHLFVALGHVSIFHHVEERERETEGDRRKQKETEGNRRKRHEKEGKGRKRKEKEGKGRKRKEGNKQIEK